MESFLIKGGIPLKGSVQLGGAKNAGFKLMIASLLSDSEITLLNVSDIGDVLTVMEIMKSLGSKIEKRGARTLYINSNKISSFEIPKEYGERSRASILFAGPLLSRFGKAVIPFPGGDRIGERPLDRHFGFLKAMGAEIQDLNDDYVTLSSKRLKGAHFKFPKNTHTGTENAIIAATLAEGKTIIENAALEPEIDDLIRFLNKIGAKIKRTEERIIEIEGVKYLGSGVHKIMPDRNEAVTYACAAIATKGDVIVENANPDHIRIFLHKLDEANGGYEIDNECGIRFFYKGDIKPTKIITRPHPGFMTDWQPLWASLMLHAKGGTSEIIESIYEERFGFVEEMKKMGAKIEYFDPKPEDPDKFYNFNYDETKDHSKHGIRIKVDQKLKPTKSKLRDVRFGAALVITALSIEGESILEDVSHIDRGYENLDLKLKELGANITKVVE